ncbi:MAG: hypothetical protein IH944_10725 [Armatimonadetes bacterium]|nr:hypothetical protein [Armatimonadota bacterium]
MLAALAACYVIAQQKTFDFDHRAAPAPVIVKALGEGIGVEMRADGNLRDDILVVHLADATQEQAMEWIAHVVEGEWQLDKGVLRLTRSKATELRQEKESSDRRLAEWAQKYRSTEVPPPLNADGADSLAFMLQDASADQARIRRFNYPPHEIAKLTPGHRMAVRLLREFDPSPFFDMPQGVTVYLPFDNASADPRLPRQTSTFAGDYEREDRLYAAAMQSRGVDVSRVQLWRQIGPGDWDSGAFTGVLTIRRQPQGLVPTIQMRWGEPRIARTVRISSPETPPYAYKPSTHEEWWAPCVLPELTLGFLPLRAPGRLGPGKLTQDVPEVVAKFFTSKDFEPLHLGSHPITVQAGESLGKSVVALLQDKHWTNFRALIRNMEGQLGWVFDLVIGRGDSLIEERDEVLLVRPADPAKTRRARVPRDLYSAMVRDGLKHGDDFEAYARLIAGSSREAVAYDRRDVSSLVTRIEYLRPYASNYQVPVRLYGSLSDSQKSRARDGGVFVDWASLSADSQRDWYFTLMDVGNVGRPGEISLEVGPGMGERRDKIVAVRRMVAQNRLPDGLLVELRREPVLVGQSMQGQRQYLQAIFSNSLFALVASKELGNGGWATMNQFLVKERIVLEIKIRAGGRWHLVSSYWEVPVKEGYETFGFGEVPPSIYEPFRAQIEEMKKMMQDPPGLPSDPRALLADAAMKNGDALRSSLADRRIRSVRQ